MFGPCDLTPDQNQAIYHLTHHQHSLLCADVGTGKTVMSLTAANEYSVLNKVKRWLVLGPLLVIDDTWRNEVNEWSHLQNLNVAIATGTPAERMKALRSDADVVAINYENVRWLMDTLKNNADIQPFDGLIADEIDKLKDVRSARFKAFRNTIKNFVVRIGLTGTLIPNELTEVWGQTYIIDGGKRFGRSFYKFRREYFYPVDYNEYNWRVLPHKEPDIVEKVRTLALRVEGKNLPKVVLLKPAKLIMPDATREIYTEFARELFLDLEGVDYELDAANQAVLSGKLQQICSGFSYVEPTQCGKCEGKKLPPRLSVGGKPMKSMWQCADCGYIEHRHTVWHNQERFKWLESVVKNTVNKDKQLMVFYNFTEEGAELQRRYDIPLLGGGTKTSVKRDVIRAWNAGDLPMVGLHPASAAHGLNLQKSGAHNIAFLTEPWSGGLRTQAIGRLARRGQRAREIYVHTAQFVGTVDEKVHNSGKAKINLRETFLNQLNKAG